ncbi:MAG: hypothetical protein COU22_01785 [Candidatus Komeilibacteria bacterium CG10_big_fil_rev_8_21_14_0_10_41_13]|uniref:Homing endonuclease LAGLIDADG domain-containing protein n=1 Tax=Candidatus Komeilibacteria bacterium CG10_big_fil_rev_8_21_14_0_10_41_13 TaxID=1974476 RepID=A0A2M6WCP6_9BACT|nr:MAG: hypothetical protein COU22_01785 [Candidatus Komeilibacteria bacterium CG10_big_fil_rev_8_21_14_0_10_41_13]
MNMTWEYIAGFFDGEGCLTRKQGGFNLTIAQTHYEVLERINQFVGYGSIFKETKRQPHWKDSWVYYIARQEDIYNFLLKLSPLLIVKRDYIKTVLPEIKLKAETINKNRLLAKARVVQAKKLRSQGLTYRQMAKIMNIDFGHARRLTLK